MKVKCFVCGKEKNLEGTLSDDVRFYCSTKCWDKRVSEK